MASKTEDVLSSTFYAFPLSGKGEAFLLRTTAEGQPRSVVVDAGYAGKGPGSLFGAMTREAPDLNTIDRLICSHEDADHCRGMPEFIRAWMQSQRTIGQLWLPALWSVGGAGRTRTGWNASEIVNGAFEVAPAIADKLRDLKKELAADGEDHAGLRATIRHAAADLARETSELDELLGRSIEDSNAADADGFLPGEPVPAEADWLNEIDPSLLEKLSDFPAMIPIRDLPQMAWPLVSFKQLADAVTRSLTKLPRSVEFFIKRPECVAMMLARDALRTHQRIGMFQ